MTVRLVSDNEGNYPDELSFYTPTFQCSRCYHIITQSDVDRIEDDKCPQCPDYHVTFIEIEVKE